MVGGEPFSGQWMFHEVSIVFFDVDIHIVTFGVTGRKG